MSIHPTAIVAAGSVIPESCVVGPYCTVGPDVKLGEGCELVSHVVLDGRTTLGAGCKVYSFACVGISPQDLKYAGEPTGVEIGERTTDSGECDDFAGDGGRGRGRRGWGRTA